MTVEMHRPFSADRVSAQGTNVTVEATAEECAALAARMNLPAILSLRCRLHLEADGESAVNVAGHLVAKVTQVCVVSLDEFDATVEERFKVRFVPSGKEVEDDDPETIDEIPYEGRLIDLGEAVSEQLGLALDPYPRMPGAALPVDDGAGALNPFAALAVLKRKQ